MEGGLSIPSVNTTGEFYQMDTDSSVTNTKILITISILTKEMIELKNQNMLVHDRLVELTSILDETKMNVPESWFNCAGVNSLASVNQQ